MTAPICPAHKKPGRYVFGSMVTCHVCDAELEAERTRTLPPQKLQALTRGVVWIENADDLAQDIQDRIERVMREGVRIPARQALDPLFDFTDCEGDDS